MPYAKGGEYRKFYGNNWWVVDWSNEARNFYMTNNTSNLLNESYWFKEGITYTDITTKGFNARYMPSGFIYDKAGPAFHPTKLLKPLLSYINSSAVNYALNVLNPTIHCQVRDLKSIPVPKSVCEIDLLDSQLLVDMSKNDWDSYETSWDFNTLPLLKEQCHKSTLADSYQKLRNYWRQMTNDTKRLEEKNNRIFINAYGLQDELTQEVPLKEITLTCNPYYRYGGVKTDDELEALLLADTMRELISYAVGCMFGRYSLDKPGLILANQGEKIEQYFEQIPNPSFLPDKNNVIPILDDGWFSDDIVERFRKFIKVAFGEEQYESNMQFIEQSLGKNDKPRDIRDYFLKDFYDDHVKRYKKRPIYWLFTSGNFSALIYMHRYQPDTVSIVLNDYLREFRTKLNAYKDQLTAINISSDQSQSEKTKAIKKLETTAKMITEMEEYERDVLYPLATKQIEIDLDDGVKVNYPKFGTALKKVTGLS